jgi:hypothetical protein
MAGRYYGGKRDQSDFALSSVAPFTVGDEKVAPQQVPSDVFSCATTAVLGGTGNGPLVGLFMAVTLSEALSGSGLSLSATYVMPSDAPLELRNCQPVARALHVPPLPCVGAPENASV